MNQQPDKLFKQKLENYQRPAPTHAWSRIEAGLSKKNNKGLWLKIAASLLLLATVMYGILSLNKQEVKPENTLTEKRPVTNQPVVTDKIDSTYQEKITSPTVSNEAESRSKVTEIAKPKNPKQIEPRANEAMKSNLAETEILKNEVAPEEENRNVIEQVDQEVAQSGKRKNFKLVIEADEVNEKYLNKSSIAKATSPDDNSSGIKKLLDKAQDLKNNQDPFGDLRQMKNEILALNFQTNKKHEQNK